MRRGSPGLRCGRGPLPHLRLLHHIDERDHWRKNEIRCGGLETPGSGVMTNTMRTFVGAVALLLLGTLAGADAATINFDDGTAPTSGPEPVQPYNVDGVQSGFSNATYVSYSKLGIVGPDFPEISGNLAIQQYVYTGTHYLPVLVDFSSDVSSVSIWAITTGGSTQSTSTSLTAYDKNDVIIGQASAIVGGNYPTAPAGADFARLLSVSAPDIARIELQGFLSAGGSNGFFVSFDDLRVFPAASAVLLPPAFMLFGTGMVLLCSMGLHRRSS